MRRDRRVTRDYFQSCEGLEAVISCYGKCAKLATAFIDDISPLTWGPGYEITGPNDNCFIEKFDELFNQDGQCSFQIWKSRYTWKILNLNSNFLSFGLSKCYASKIDEVREARGFEGFACASLKVIQDCVKEVKPNCKDFIDKQATLSAVLVKKFHELDDDVPYKGWLHNGEFPCLKPYLPKEPVQEFPIFNKLVEELVMIQQRLNL